MHSLATIVGAFLTSKENYLEYSRKINTTFIYNELWDSILEGETIRTEVGQALKYDPKPPEIHK